MRDNFYITIALTIVLLGLLILGICNNKANNKRKFEVGDCAVFKENIGKLNEYNVLRILELNENGYESCFLFICEHVLNNEYNPFLIRFEWEKQLKKIPCN